MMKSISLAFLLYFSYLAFADPAGDKITSLPNFSGDLGNQYSGYLEINNQTGKFLHYWFVESDNNPATDPVVLWLNGGPGCSSLDGFWYEQGPLHFAPGAGNLTVVRNPWAWTRIANMIFLEAPAGVGFSYSNTQNDYNTDDNQTADDNHAFLNAFFQTYPQFRSNPFFIAGESYAGIYVPTLAYRVMQDASINFKGIMVGNGVSDSFYDSDLQSFLPFAYFHGIISTSTWNDINNYCQGSNFDQAKCDAATGQVQQNMQEIDIYDIYGDCYHQRPAPAQRTFGKGLGLVPPCIDSTKAEDYLNLPEVKKAIHVRTDIQWDICTTQINYNSDTDSVIPIYKQLIKGGYQILVFSGDTDGAVPYVGSEKWTASLGLPVIRSWAPWYIQDDEGKQAAGFVTDYQGLSFTTVRGSGHMVPQFRPEAAFYMFQQFIQGQPL